MGAARTGMAGCLSWAAEPSVLPRVGDGVRVLGDLPPLPKSRALRATGAGLYSGPLYAPPRAALRSAGAGLAAAAQARPAVRRAPGALPAGGDGARHDALV